MSSVHGNMNHFQMYHDGALQMSSVVNSGWWLAAPCVNYARVRCHVSGIRRYLTLLSEKCVRFVFRLWSVRRNQLLQLGKFRSEGGQMRRNTDPQEKEDQLHAAANRGAGESLLRHQISRYLPPGATGGSDRSTGVQNSGDEGLIV